MRGDPFRNRFHPLPTLFQCIGSKQLGDEIEFGKKFDVVGLESID